MIRRNRRIGNEFDDHYFKPRGIPLSELDQVSLSKEEMEVLRLRFIERMKQIEAAELMGISQSQYQRDMYEALTKIVDALIEGKAIQINKEQQRK